MNKINKRKVSFLSHVARSKGLDNDILSGMVSGKRRRGSLEGNWRTMFTKSLEFQWPSCFRVRGIETPCGQPLRVPRRVSPDPSVHDDDEAGKLDSGLYFSRKLSEQSLCMIL